MFSLSQTVGGRGLRGPLLLFEYSKARLPLLPQLKQPQWLATLSPLSYSFCHSVEQLHVCLCVLASRVALVDLNQGSQ